MKPQAIHQFHSGSAYGDAITNGMLFIQQMLIDLGFESNIYVQFIADEYKNKLLHYSKHQSSQANILLLHH